MKLTKAFLILNVIMWLPYGIACIVNPGLPTGFSGLEMTSATAMTEIRSMYGGVQSAMGVMCLMAVFASSLVRPALGAVAFVFSGLAIARVVGFLLDSSGSEYTYGAMGFEAVGAAVSMYLFVKQPLHTP
ncbi:DUF4345 domain-containing protein [Ketobacter sp. MCCC 1A13808]|uniref:DUF4345 domain-containing protein n=1 Tax=Ketobacter sp. MCCC 1A13808 TaxID=2602738 RepID=UPI000F1831C5|nr:DUF4345 domain-containing protein [Ketobacter sp. MCCC 1A13808]MVF13576.1 DUF4345 domain-containing protein [Ketobacter sp. MCCC 1A13808]RLP53319.1 MAG: DUF4345 domain-containing protein [Ketobacter sp.]